MWATLICMAMVVQVDAKDLQSRVHRTMPEVLAKSFAEIVALKSVEKSLPAGSKESTTSEEKKVLQLLRANTICARWKLSQMNLLRRRDAKTLCAGP